MDNLPFEEQYLDILQNIEAAILSVYRELPDLVDLQVDTAIEALIRAYQAEGTGRQAMDPRSDSARAVYVAVRRVTEWRLGRQGYANDEQKDVYIQAPISIPETMDCLKRIRKSIRLWNKQNGRQGYLNYIDMFIK